MSELTLNPNLQLTRLRLDGNTTGYRIHAPIKGRGRVETLVEPGSASPEVLEAMHGLVEGDGDVELSETACERLAELGVLVHEHEISTPVRFRCDLGAAPAERVDAAALVAADVELTTVDELARRHPGLTAILEPGDVVLVRDPRTGARLPYWLSRREVALVRALVPGAPPPSGLDGAEVARLARAGLLVARDAAAHADVSLAAVTAQFARGRFAVLPGTLPPAQIGALGGYYRALVAEGYVQAADTQVPLRHARHNEPLMRWYHRELTAWFARVAAAAIKPSYGYFASYRPGATLKRHIDRPQCALTASLLLDFAGAAAWPLHLAQPAGGEEIAVELAPGDAVLYRGCELPHWREAFDGERSASYFLHYVDEEFAGVLD